MDMDDIPPMAGQQQNNTSRAQKQPDSDDETFDLLSNISKAQIER
jgi:hypothetical protein